MFVIKEATIHTNGAGSCILFFDFCYDPEVEQAVKKGKPVHITVASPRQAKKTGEGSRLNLVHLWFREIAQQLDMDEDQVKDAMKRMSVSEGWPTCLNPVDGKEEPVGMRWVSEESMGIIANVTELFAMLNGLNLSKEVQ